MTASNAAGNVLYMGARLKPRTPQSDADRLRAIYARRKAELGFDQRRAGESMGISQTMVSQYLKGTKALGVDALLRWAKFLQVSPIEIQPGFEYRDMVPGKLTQAQLEVAVLWGELPEPLASSIRDQIRTTVRTLRPRVT